jgi:hypothetical protein
MGFFLTLAAFAGGYATGAKMGDRPMVLARNAMNDVSRTGDFSGGLRAESSRRTRRCLSSITAGPRISLNNNNETEEKKKKKN